MYNLNVDAIKKFKEEVQKDESIAKKTKVVTGNWVFEEGKPQFVSTLEYQNGKTTLSSEMPSFFGGWGNSPDPIQYGLYGLAACISATFVSSAQEVGIELKKFEIRIENSMDMKKMLGLSMEDIIKSVKVLISVDGPSDEEFQKLVDMTKQRCPGVECVTRPIPLEVELNK